eukprot:172329-Amphidinium_carterae.1
MGVSTCALVARLAFVTLWLLGIALVAALWTERPFSSSRVKARLPAHQLMPASSRTLLSIWYKTCPRTRTPGDWLSALTSAWTWVSNAHLPTYHKRS